MIQTLTSMRSAIVMMMVIIGIALIATLFFPQADVFHALWFQALLVLFCLNMTVCTIKRIRALMTLTRAVPMIKPAPGWMKKEWLGSVDAAAAEELLRRKGYRYQRQDTTQGTVFSADKGLSGSWGTLAVHVAILIIALGALIGNVFGFTQSVVIGKGETIAVPLNKSGSIQAQLVLDDFRIEYYPDGSVSEYISDLRIEAGSEKAAQSVRINHPLDFRGITLYQMDHGYQVLAEQQAAGGAPQESLWLSQSASLAIDKEQGITLQVINYVPDFDPHRPAISLSPFPNNPRVLYAFYQQGNAVQWGVAALGQPLVLQGLDKKVVFADVRPYSLLDLKSDPGVPVVMVGFLLLSVAFFFSMLIRYHCLFIQVILLAKGTKITAAVSRLTAAPAEVLMTELERELTKGDHRA